MAASTTLCRCVVLWYGLVCTVNSTKTQCNAPQTPDFNLSIDSQRNDTGHLIAQVKIEHISNKALGQLHTGPWKVDIDHSTAKCQDAESVLTVATITAPPPRAGPNYELIPGLGYYKLHTDIKNWYDARLTCAQEGAHLAIMNSELEATEMKVILGRLSKVFSDWRNSFAFIGISDIQTEGKWITIFGQPLNTTGFTKWNTGEPSKGSTEHCGALNKTSGALHDYGCEAAIPFLCEQEL